MVSSENYNCSPYQVTWLVLLRVAIGWHFLYEGIVKVMNPGWSALAYLTDSAGPFGGFFRFLAGNNGLLNTVDFLNQWGLVLIGLGLILGIFTKVSEWAGMILLAVYYLSHPPFLGLDFAFPAEGSYLVVDKNLVEIIALGVLSSFPTGRIIGLDRLFHGKVR